MPEGNEQEKKGGATEFAYHIHAYLRQFIQAADQKAAFTLAASGAVLGFLISRLSDSRSPDSVCLWVLGVTGAALLVIAAGLAAWSVRPRQNDVKTGLVGWGGILRSGNADEYTKSVCNADPNQEVLTHCYELSSIIQHKYALLKLAINFFILGSAVTIVALAIAIVERYAHPSA